MSQPLSESSTSQPKEKDDSSLTTLVLASSEWTSLRGRIHDRLPQAMTLQEARELAALELLLTVAPFAELAVAKLADQQLIDIWSSVREDVFEILSRQ